MGLLEEMQAKKKAGTAALPRNPQQDEVDRHAGSASEASTDHIDPETDRKKSFEKSFKSMGQDY